MFGKPKYESDIDQTVRDMWWGFAIFITVMYFLVKATYYVALPFYTLFTHLFEEKVQQKEYLNWMRFLPLTWFMSGETKEMRRAAVSCTILPISLPLFLVFNYLYSIKVIDDSFSIFILILFTCSLGGIIGTVRNYRFSKKYIR